MSIAKWLPRNHFATLTSIGARSHARRYRAAMRMRLTLAAAAVPLLLLATPAGASADVLPGADLAPSPGALTQGDPYLPTMGNGGYRVGHYDLRLRYAPRTRRLDGTVTIAATTTQDLSAFSLDLLGMRVASVLVDGAPAAFRRRATKLVITPPVPLPVARAFTVAVTYSGVPTVGAGGIGGTGWYAHNGVAAAYDEPDGAQRWFPNDGSTTAKAPYDITVTVPAGLTVVSNGGLVSHRTDRRAQTTTWHWRERAPMIAYAATVAIGRFALARTRTSHGVTVYTAVQRSLPATAKSVIRRQFSELPRLLRFFRARFGPYPFDVAGGIAGRFGFGSAPLETQTKPLYDGAFSSSIQAHEIAHQWFGDSVTLTRWSDIWLHEGFATYAQWLWDYRTPRALAQAFQQVWESWAATAPALAAPGSNLFSDVTYERGGATLVGLQLLMGDRPFFALLREWAATHRHGNATTEELVALARLRGGPEVEPFLHAWLYDQR